MDLVGEDDMHLPIDVDTHEHWCLVGSHHYYCETGHWNEARYITGSKGCCSTHGAELRLAGIRLGCF